MNNAISITFVLTVIHTFYQAKGLSLLVFPFLHEWWFGFLGLVTHACPHQLSNQGHNLPSGFIPRTSINQRSINTEHKVGVLKMKTILYWYYPWLLFWLEPVGVWNCVLPLNHKWLNQQMVMVFCKSLHGLFQNKNVFNNSSKTSYMCHLHGLSCCCWNLKFFCLFVF